MDITLHCVDSNDLKNKGLTEVSPSICKFNQVSHCSTSRRISGEYNFLENMIIFSKNRQLFSNFTMKRMKTIKFIEEN